MTRQLTDKSLTSHDFHHFTRVLSALVPGFSGGALYELASGNLWTSAGFSKSVEDEVRISLAEQKGGPASAVAGELQPKRLSNDSLLFSHTLSNHIQEPVGTIFLLIRPEKGVDAHALEKKMAEAIKAIAAILSEGHRLNSELDAMADELSIRYEELNLVYETVDQTDDFAAIQQTLKLLVKNCAIALDAPYSVLILLDKKICLNHASNTHVIDNKDSLDKQLNRLYAWTTKSSLPLVINDENDPVWDKLHMKLPYKLLSYPVYDKTGKTLGVIASLKEKSAADFVNSDRNLLMVMANKASKIIQSNYDLLTGLLNLEAFKYLLRGIHFSPSPLVPESHALLYIDIDHMKVINETIGHEAGDAVLRALGRLLKGTIRDKDFAARMGGDIFGVLLYNSSPERAMITAKRFKSKIEQLRLSWDGKDISVTASMGLASLSAESPDIESALDEAEIACNSAKAQGKSRIRFFKFGDVDHTIMKNEMWWVNILQEALSKNDLQLYCQKIHPFKNEVGLLFNEILVRILDDKGEIVTPQEFIPAAERYQLMPGIDRWVIDNTLKLLEKKWEKLQHLRTLWSINISGQSFMDETFLDFITSSLQSSAVPADRICFEITETAAIGDLIAAQFFITSLRNIGCHFALDDFGSGLSSFTYLKNLDVDFLKIDGSIVKDIAESNVARSMVKAIKDVAETLGIYTVGEYVETEAIAERLSLIGVDYAQGYFFGRPLPLENELEKILTVKKTA